VQGLQTSSTERAGCHIVDHHLFPGLVEGVGTTVRKGTRNIAFTRSSTQGEARGNPWPQFLAGTYLWFLGLTEAQMVCDLTSSARAEIAQRSSAFWPKVACSPGFRPGPRDLFPGLALAHSDHHAQSETEEIGRMLSAPCCNAMARSPLNEGTFLAFQYDLADATQERQDAHVLPGGRPLDLILGGDRAG